MKINLDQVITPSKLQPKIFQITKVLAQDKEGKFFAVVGRDNQIITYIVSPVLFERLYDPKTDKKRLEEKMKKDYQDYTMEEEEKILERASLEDLSSEEGDISEEEEKYYQNL